jgi:hypothetical protein
MKKIKFEWEKILSSLNQKNSISEMYLFGYAWSRFLLQVKQGDIEDVKYVKVLIRNEEVDITKLLDFGKICTDEFHLILMIKAEFISVYSKSNFYNVSRNPNDEFDRYSYILTMPNIYLPAYIEDIDLRKKISEIFSVFLNKNWDILKSELRSIFLLFGLKDKILHCLLKIKNPNNSVHRTEVYELESFMKFYTLQ